MVKMVAKNKKNKEKVKVKQKRKNNQNKLVKIDGSKCYGEKKRNKKKK